MKLIGFAAPFLHLTVSIPDGRVHLSPRYCIPNESAPLAQFDTDFADVSREQMQTNCSIAIRALRVEITHTE